jgi:AraC-like DNA-binding protein/mannose-6-phosphate isomerase-like protein (cupin superfamily)
MQRHGESICLVANLTRCSQFIDLEALSELCIMNINETNLCEEPSLAAVESHPARPRPNRVRPQASGLDQTRALMKARCKDNEVHDLAARLNFKPHRLRLDHTARYEETLDAEFPFLIRLFHFRHNDFTPIHSSRERLELFMPLDGAMCMVMGERPVELAPGELLIVQNMKPHRLIDSPKLNTRAVVISFLPNFVYSLGSPSHDYFFLLPFYTNVGNRVHVVRDAAFLQDIHGILARLLQCYFDRTSYFQIGCKAYFLELLYHLAAYFRAAEVHHSELMRHRVRSAKLKPVLEFVEKHFANPITLTEASSLAKMSVPQFTKLFKNITGTTFVSYVTHVRLSRAVRLLKESSLTIAEVANQVGFTDQSYFDRRFKAAFRRTPRDFRPKAAATLRGFFVGNL